MKVRPISFGFSLVEILVSLMVVSLVAVNISGLQKIVADQGRDNFSHSLVIALLSEKFEAIMEMQSLQDIIDLNGSSSNYTLSATLFTLTWRIETVLGVSSVSPVYDVEASITWSDAIGDIQVFTHTQQVSQAMLLEQEATSDFPYIIPNLLNTQKVGYFESKMGYKNDAYVIYDSQLFQANDSHPINGGDLQSPPINTVGEISAGWIKLGSIDDHTLASLFID